MNFADSDPSVVPSWLFGRWRLLRADPSLDFAPGVRMDFREGGVLLYTIVIEQQEHVISLIYRVTGDMLQTDNPAAPHRTSTRFFLGEADMLIFDFAGALASFVRER